MEKQMVHPAKEIWKILKATSLAQEEYRKEHRKQMQEADRRMKESKKEADRRMKKMDRMLEESKKETDRTIQATNRKIEENEKEYIRYKEGLDRHIRAMEGHFNNQWGALIEALIEGSLIDILKEQGLSQLTRLIPGYRGKQNKEFDLLAVDGKEMLVVETKSYLNQKKVDAFLEVIKNFKEYCPEYGAVKVYGGMACLKAQEGVFSYAHKKGLFVIKVKGKNATLMNKKNFKPKAFC